MCMSFLYWNWTQCSWHVLTSAEQRGRILSLDLLAMLSLAQRRIPFTFFATRARFWLVFNLVSTRTRRAFSAELLSSWMAPAYICAWGCSSPGAGLCTSVLVELHVVPISPILQPVKVLLTGSRKVFYGCILKLRKQTQIV